MGAEKARAGSRTHQHEQEAQSIPAKRSRLLDGVRSAAATTSSRAPQRGRAHSTDDHQVDDEDAFLADMPLPSDVEAAVLFLRQEFVKQAALHQAARSLAASMAAVSPPGDGAGQQQPQQLPPLVLVSQLHSMIKDKSRVEPQVEALRRRNAVRMLKLPTGADEHGLMLTTDYTRAVTQAAAAAAAAAEGQQEQPGAGHGQARSSQGQASRSSSRAAPEIVVAHAFCTNVVPQHTEVSISSARLLALLNQQQQQQQQPPAAVHTAPQRQQQQQQQLQSPSGQQHQQQPQQQQVQQQMQGLNGQQHHQQLQHQQQGQQQGSVQARSSLLVNYTLFGLPSRGVNSLQQQPPHHQQQAGASASGSSSGGPLTTAAPSPVAAAAAAGAGNGGATSSSPSAAATATTAAAAAITPPVRRRVVMRPKSATATASVSGPTSQATPSGSPSGTTTAAGAASHHQHQQRQLQWEQQQQQREDAAISLQGGLREISGEQQVTLLLQLGVLARHPVDDAAFLLCCPGMGPVIKSIIAGRTELVSFISRKPHKEVSERALLGDGGIVAGPGLFPAAGPSNGASHAGHITPGAGTANNSSWEASYAAAGGVVASGSRQALDIPSSNYPRRTKRKVDPPPSETDGGFLRPVVIDLPVSSRFAAQRPAGLKPAAAAKPVVAKPGVRLKQSVLGVAFHLRDLLGRGQLVRVVTPSGPVIKVQDRS